MLLLLPIITLVIILCAYLRKNGKCLDIVTLLILVYLVMGISSVVLELSGMFPSKLTFEFEPMAYLSLCLFVVFLGFTGFNNSKFKAIKIENLVLYRTMEISLLIGGTFAIIFFLPHAIIALSGDIAENRINLVSKGTHLSAWGIVNSFFSLLANCSILAQICSFLNLVPRAGKVNRIRAYSLLISSLSYVVYILAYVGRDGIVYWMMSYLFCLLLFRDFVERNELKKLNRFVFLCSTILLCLFVIITIARFPGTIGATVWQVLDYAGQQIRNFNDHYQIDAPLSHGRFVFPEFVKLMDYVGIDVGPNVDQQMRNSFFLKKGVQPWVFTTFIGLLMIDIGKIGTLVYLVVISCITRMLLREVSSTGIFRFSNLMLFILFYQISYWGVFYYRQYSANFYMLGVILLFFFFKITEDSRKTVFFIKANQFALGRRA